MNTLLYEIKKSISSNQTYTILFYGDSTTSTEWVFPSWRAILEYAIKMSLENTRAGWNLSWWNLKFINSGLDGATTQDLIERLDRDVFRYQPNLLIGILGDNDVDKFSVEQHGRNIRTLLDLISQKIPHTVYSPGLTTINPTHNKKYAELIKAESLESLDSTKIHLVNLFEEFKKYNHERFFTFEFNKGEEFLSDGAGGKIDAFHPAAQGQAYIAKILLERIFDIQFDPELFLKTWREGAKTPRY